MEQRMKNTNDLKFTKDEIEKNYLLHFFFLTKDGSSWICQINEILLRTIETGLKVND